jgi:putative hemolysin
MPAEIVIFLACLALSGFFSGSETALIGANRLRLRHLAGEGDHAAQRILHLIDDPRRMLAGILVGNNLVNIVAAVVMGSFFTAFYGSEGMGAVVATAVTTPLLVLFGEFLPKTLAAARPVRFARAIVRPLGVVLRLLAPVVWPLEALTRPLGALARGRRDIGLAEVRAAVVEGVRAGTLDRTLARVLQGGLSLEWKTAGDILVPRVDVVGVDADATYAQSLEVFRREHYSRVVVMHGSIDAELGYLAAKDLLRLGPREQEGWTARKAMRKALRVPATIPLWRLLAQMRQTGAHLAVVKDEYGGTEGIVTLEDVLEELVGEIRDEHDVEEVPPFRELGGGAWAVRGDVAVRAVNERLAVALPAEEARTLGGFFAEALGRLPRKGDILTEAGVKLAATVVEDNRVLEVRVEPPPPPAPAP